MSCSACEGRSKGCDECYGEGTYEAYSEVQAHRLARFLVERGRISPATAARLVMGEQ